MELALFTKTYERDYQWLELLGKSIDRFCKNFDRWHVVYDASDPQPTLQLNNIEVVYHQCIVPKPEHQVPCPFKYHPGLNSIGYNYQQVVKMYWHKYATDEEGVVQVDSDVVFLEDFYPQSAMVYGKPEWVKIEWSTNGTETRTWKEAVDQFIGMETDHYYMQTPTYTLTRQATEAFHSFVNEKHGVTFEAYAMNHEVSEYNFFGAFIDCISLDPPCCGYVISARRAHQYPGVRKYWSWGKNEHYNKAVEDFNKAKDKNSC